MAKLTNEEQKSLAIARLKQMGIYNPYIKEFDKKGVVTFFENFGGFWATADNGEPELEAYIKKHEEETGDLVYAVTHNIFEFGECYSLLIISSYAEDEKQELLDKEGNNLFYPYSYVWNKDVPEFSEYGTIIVAAFGGGIKRMG